MEGQSYVFNHITVTVQQELQDPNVALLEIYTP